MQFMAGLCRFHLPNHIVASLNRAGFRDYGKCVRRQFPAMPTRRIIPRAKEVKRNWQKQT